MPSESLVPYQLSDALEYQRRTPFELGAVTSEAALEEGGWTLDLKITEKDLKRFLKRENLAEQQLDPLPMRPSATAANE